MAIKYCDPTLYTYAASPTTNAAQEGDGSAAGAATSAVAEIDCSSLTSGSGATISIAGSSGISIAQPQTGATLASTIASAINASTATVANQGGAETWATTIQVRDWCYARQKSGNTSVVEIMTRAGSNRFNYDVNSGVAITFGGTWTGDTNAARTQFGGGSLQRGAGGAWGYVLNGATIWPSAKAAWDYGLWSGSKLIAGVPTPGDTVYIRPGNVTVMRDIGDVTPTYHGTASAPIHWVFDDGTMVPAWDVDAGQNKVFTLYGRANSWNVGQAFGNFWYIRGGRYANGDANLRFNRPSGIYNWSLGIFYAQQSEIVNADFLATARIAFPWGTGYSRSAINGSRIRGCKHVGGSYTEPPTGTPYDYDGYMEWVDCEFLGANLSGYIAFGLAGSYNVAGVARFENCRFTNFQTGTQLTAAQPAGYGSVRIFELINCELGNITKIAGLIANDSTGEPSTHRLIVQKQAGDRQSLYEDRRGFVEWNPNRSFPKLNALLPNGNKWSLRVWPRYQANRKNPFRLPRFQIVDPNATSAVRSITVQFLADQTLSVVDGDITVSLSYLKPDGTLARDDFNEAAGNAPAITASTETWTQEVAGVPQFDESGTRSYNKRKVTVTTSQPVLAGSEMWIEVGIGKQVSDAVSFFFVDPEPTVS